MAHQKETPPEGGETERAGRELGQAIIDAMAAWGDKNGGAADARVPMIALHVALSRVLNAMPPAKRRRYAEDFIRALSNTAGSPS